jgi:hypothetical protein
MNDTCGKTMHMKPMDSFTVLNLSLEAIWAAISSKWPIQPVGKMIAHC